MTRFAIYLSPQPGSEGEPLLQAAESWLGRSAIPGTTRPGANVVEEEDRTKIDPVTANARRYGFHATIVAPFRIAEGHDPDDLETIVRALAARHRPFGLALRLARLPGGFFALIPLERFAPLHALEADAVRATAPLKAPLTDRERAHRHPDRLTSRQRRLLDVYGYPYVLDEFLAHFTLTARIPRDHADEVEVSLSRRFDALAHDGVEVDGLAIFVEPEPGAPFTQRRFVPFATGSGAASGAGAAAVPAATAIPTSTSDLER